MPAQLLLKSLALPLFCCICCSSGNMALLFSAQARDSDNICRPEVQKNASKTWKLTGVGEVEAHDGTSLYFKTYTARDGSTVTITHGQFDSTKGPLEELTALSSKAKKILERNPKTDSSGKVIGQRVVALLPESNSKSEITAILWTKEMHFYQITSSSLQVALEWEKKYKK